MDRPGRGLQQRGNGWRLQRLRLHLKMSECKT
jgi:hypothetical protein